MDRDSHKRYKFSEFDKISLSMLEPVVEGIAKIFGGNCEVVLHSLENYNKSVIAIENGHITKREIGSPITDYVIESLSLSNETKKNVIGSYFTKTKDGKDLKSVKIIIRNHEGEALGILCINIDLSSSLTSYMQDFLPDQNLSANGSREHFPADIDTLIHRSFLSVSEEVNQKPRLSASAKNRQIIVKLFEKGIFDIKGAVNIVATEMDISRATLYNYLRDAKNS